MNFHFLATPGHTVALEDRDYPEWRRGRERYAIWMIDADIAPLCQRVELAREHLHGLLTPHQRAPHITLFVCGFMVENLLLDDDFDVQRQALQRRAIAAEAIPPFTLHIGGLDSFDTAVFLRVDDPTGSLERLRTVLAQDCAEIRQAPYVPHLTIGFYRAAFDKRELSSRLTAFNEFAPLDLHIDRLHFTTYAARALDGSLDVIDTVELANSTHQNSLHVPSQGD